MRKYLTVIDTNVLVSAILNPDENSPPSFIIRESFGGMIVPLYNQYLLNEYREVLTRDRFQLSTEYVELLIQSLIEFGIRIDVSECSIPLPDKKDVPIFALVHSTRDMGSYLVTGNTKHFPKVDYVITPREMMNLMIDGHTRR